MDRKDESRCVNIESMKYTEILKLRDMLERANIPHDYEDHSISMVLVPNGRHEHYQISYPCAGIERVISVVEGDGTYGHEANLLEIMGLLTAEEKANDSVAGWLTADEVFARIQRHLKELSTHGNKL